MPCAVTWPTCAPASAIRAPPAAPPRRYCVCKTVPMTRHWALSAAVVAAMTVATSATVTLPTDFRQVVALATVVVRGHVTDVRTVAPPGGRVETVATVAVDAALKGTPGAFIS